MSQIGGTFVINDEAAASLANQQIIAFRDVEQTRTQSKQAVLPSKSGLPCPVPNHKSGSELA